MKFLIIFLLSTNIFAKTYEIKQNDKNKAEFLGDSIMGIVSIPGEGGKVTGFAKEEKGLISGEFQVDVTKMKTGMSLRDRHMHEKYLETKKYPKVKLVLKPVKLAEKMKFKADLTIKGKTKPIEGTASFKDNLLNAEFDLLLSHYPNIGAPSFGDVAMDDKVEVKVQFEVKEK